MRGTHGTGLISTYLRASVSAGFFGVRSECAPLGGRKSVPGARGRNQHFLLFSKAGTRKIQCFRPSGALKNNAFEAIKHCKLQCFVASEATKHCKLQCFVASKRVFACFGGSRAPPGGPWPSRGAPGGLWGPFWALFWGFLRLSWRLLGRSWRLLGRSWRLLGRSREAQEAPEGSKLALGGTKRHPRVSGFSSGVLGCRAGGVWL